MAHYYKRHVGDYVKDTIGLSMLEDGAYTRLLDQYYATGRHLPRARAELYRLARAGNAGERRAVDYVLSHFFDERADGWHQKRADSELGLITEKSRQATESGRLGGLERDRRNKELRASRLKEARKKGKHTEAEWDALKDVCGNCCLGCSSAGPLETDHIQPIYLGGSDALDNIQPLCRSCNAKKGPEVIDKRPLGWREAVAKRLLNDRSTIHKPLAISNPLENPSDSLVGQSPDATPKNGHARHDKELIATAVGIIVFLNEKTGAHYQPVKANVQMVVARLKEGFTEKIVRQVIANRCLQWKDDPKMDEFLRPKTLFAASNFASYAGLIGKTQPEGTT